MTRRTLAAAALVLLVIKPAPAQVPPGFATYLIGFMMRATGQLPGGASMQELQKSHVANLDAMWKEGLLLASGPITDTGELSRVVIFRGDQRDTVDKRIADDPLVKAGFLRVELGPWIGPLGIADEYKTRAAANPGVPDKMRTYQLVMMKTVLPARRMTPDEQRAQLLNMDALAKSGKLAAAGPVLEGSDLAWIFVYTGSAEEVDALAASDPVVKAGKMIAERHPWMVAEGILPAGFRVPLP